MALLVVAAMVFAAGIAHPVFREGGQLTGRFVVPLALAAGLVLIAVAGASAWSALAGLLAVGQAAELQLIHAGRDVAYEHWAAPSALLSPPGLWFLLFLILQAAVVAAVFSRARRQGTLRWGPSRPGPRIVLVAAAFVLTGVALSRQPSAWAAELLTAGAIHGVQLANLLLAVVLIPAERMTAWDARITRILGEPSAPARLRPDRFTVLAAVWAAAVAGILAYFVYQRHPHLPDEVGYLLQARYFAKGMLTMPAPPVPAAFSVELMTYQPARWFSPTPPAWPAALAVGVLAGAPWLVNPVLTGVDVLLAAMLVGTLYDRRMSRVVVLLLCVSPWFLYMGSNLHAHQWTMMWGLIAALGVARARSPGRRRWAWLAASGFALGVLAMLRPLEALAMAVMLAIWATASAPAVRWHRLLPALLLALVSATVSSVQLAYNRYLIGSATRFPLMEHLDSVYGAGSNALGFGANRGFGWTGLDPLPGHGAADVAINTALNSFLVNIELLGWSLGSLLPLFLFAAWGRWRRSDVIMAAAIAGIVIAHAFYWFSGGPDFGARYWYLVLVPCLVLTARGLETAGDRFPGDGPSRAARARPLAAALMLSLSALVTFMPWRGADKYWHYREMRPDIRDLSRATGFGDALVLIRGRRETDYASAAVYNPIDLRARTTIYAWDHDPEATAEVLRYYADRDVWIVDGPTITGDGYRVVAGPLPASRVPVH